MQKFISDYSGEVVGDDWSPAIAAAHADINTNGGEIIIDTDITVKTAATMTSNNNSPIDIVGQTGAKVTVDCNSSSIIPFNVGNSPRFRFLNLTFNAPVTENDNDCQAIIGTGAIEWLIVRDCIFAGVLSSDAAIKGVGATHIAVEDCQVGATKAFLHSTGANQVAVKNARMLDYMDLGGTFYDRGGGHDHWILIESPATGLGERRSAVYLERINGDERAGTHIKVEGFKRVTATQIQTNNPGNGIWLSNVDLAHISQYHGGYNANVSKGLRLVDCGSVIVDQFSYDNGIEEAGRKYISLETATTDLIVKNSPDATVNAAAGAVYELNGVKIGGGFVQIG